MPSQIRRGQPFYPLFGGYPLSETSNFLAKIDLIVETVSFSERDVTRYLLK